MNLLKVEEPFFSYELPNNWLYNFEGNLALKGYPKNLSVNSKNILLRGSVLKNTKWVVGLVIFVGKDTKLMMSRSEIPQKTSNMKN